MGRKYDPDYLRNFTTTLMGQIAELDFNGMEPKNDRDYFNPVFIKWVFRRNFSDIYGGLNRCGAEALGRIIASAGCRGVSFWLVMKEAGEKEREILDQDDGKSFLKTAAICVLFAEMMNIHREKNFKAALQK